MPQQLHIVRCYNCEIFQVDIVKKVPKWACKMCGEKQSLKTVYGTGTGKECREYVQNLNKQRLTLPTSSISENLPDISHTIFEEQLDISTSKTESKWSEYITKDECNSGVELSNFSIVKDDLIEEEIKSSNKPITLNRKEDELYFKLDLSNDRKCDNEYEENLMTGSNSTVRPGKRYSDNIKNKPNKWKRFLLNENYNTRSNSESVKVDTVIKISNDFSNYYNNKFGDSSNLDEDLQF